MAAKLPLVYLAGTRYEMRMLNLIVMHVPSPVPVGEKLVVDVGGVRIYELEIPPSHRKKD